MLTVHIFLEQYVKKYIEKKTKSNFNFLLEIWTKTQNSYLYMIYRNSYF